METKDKELSKAALVAKIKALGDITEAQKNSIICILIGHSNIVGYCFGQVTCGRCDDILGEAMFGGGNLQDRVIINHKCPECVKNFAALTWRDKYRAPNPFPATSRVKLNP